MSATTEFDIDWAQMPDGASLGDVPGVEVDAEDRVYAFTRGETPLVVFDRDGNVLASWDRGGFDDPHGIRIGPDGSLWLIDDGDHTIRRCTLEGEVLQTIGTPGEPAPFMSGRPFNKPSNIAFGPQRRHLRLRRLRQRARPPAVTRRRADPDLGRVGQRPGPVLHPARHSL